MRQNRLFFILLVIALHGAVSPYPSQSSDRDDVEKAMSGLASPAFEEKRHASDELAKIGAPAVAPLISVLENGANGVRWWAALTLGKIRSAVAVPSLITALGDKDWLVRFFAAWSLGEIKDFRAVEPLIAALGDNEFLVIKMAHDSLREITGEDFGEAQLTWRSWWERKRQGSPD